MENRKRNNQILIRLNDKELNQFNQKLKQSHCNNMNLFIRKCVLESNIIVIDLEPFADLQGLLYNATNNINQIAKQINTTGIIYKNDIENMKKDIEIFSKELWQIHSLLLNRTKKLSDK